MRPGVDVLTIKRLVFGHREGPEPENPLRTMKRSLDFQKVTSYNFSLDGPAMLLELCQGGIVTSIRITPVEYPQPERTKVIGTIKPVERIPSRPKRVLATRLNEEQVKEIRSTWEETVKRCGSKNAAADELASKYGCSAKNIYAIIYRYSWANI